MMATAVSVTPELLRFCSLSTDSVNTLLNSPTPELVRTLLNNVSSKIQDKRQDESEWLKSKVQLETALNKNDTQNRSLKASLDQAKGDVTELQRQLQEAQNERDSLEEEFGQYKRTNSASKGTLDDLYARIDSLEASNREKLSLLDAKTASYDSLVNDLNAQHQKTVELRKQLSATEQALEEQKNALSASTYREQSQKQSVEQLERRNEYLDGELKAKANDLTKFRKEKNQEISRLERHNEDVTAQIRQLQNIESTLRRTIDELNDRADERSLRAEELQQEFLQKETSYQLEIDAANRLAKLREDSSKTDRQRVQDLTQELDDHRLRNTHELGRLQAELETEHTSYEEAETKIAELEVQIERLNDEIFNLRAQEQGPATPFKNVNGLYTDHGGLSPQSHSPGSARSKGGLSITRLFSENSDLKRQITAERRKNEELSEAMTSLVADMENQAPEIEDLKTEHSRLEGEVSDLSVLLDTAGRERDQAMKAAKKHQSDLEAKIRESEILRQQLRDLSSQIKLLLMESQLRDQGRQNIGAEERAQLENLARYRSEDDGEGLTDTDKYISENLVQFRNIIELQEQNSNLLRLTRELGDRMEREETLRSQAEATHNWDELHQKYTRCKEEMKSLVTQSQSYIRERDMFRTMLENRGQSTRASEFAADGSQAPSASQAHVLDSVESTSGQSTTDYAKLVKDLQAHFDAYREEAATDRASLKQQNDDLLKSQSELRSEVARSSSQATLARDRYEMLQTNYGMLKNENSEMQKRFQDSFENSARQDLRVQQAAEDLVETRGLLDSMRNESANLKAEKEFWKTVEKRLNDDNNSLVQERSRLSALNASLQSLLNEREHTESETRRRLQAQIDGLDTEIQNANTNLRAKEEELKQLHSRREYENGQNQKRIDDLMSTLATSKEDLVRANTAKDHLSRQVDELSIELRSAKERLDVLQYQPHAHVNGTSGGADGESGPTISSEQELKVEISELNKKLALAKTELDDFKSQVEQYKAISQESEDELNSLNQTHDMYRQEIDSLIQEKNSKLQQQEQRINDMSQELEILNTEIGALRNTQAEHDRAIQDQRREYDVELAKLKDEDDRHAAAAQYYQQDLKAQASIAQQAQQNYENELVKHADAAKALQKARNDMNDLKMELVSAKTEAETARLSQVQNEDSWTESKERFEREISELRTARQDLKSQNDLLHQQVETLSKAHKRTDTGQDGVDQPSSSPTSNLQEVVTYLRREKDIVDVQLELATQEAKRLKQQLNHSQSQLDDARLKLQQQSRLEADSANSALAQRKLMETVQDLNTHREANVTLRAEARLAQAGLAARTKEVEELRSQIEPLQDQVQELKAERQADADEIKLWKDNANQWQQRAQNVLQKYDRVDPAELEALKQRITTVESERDELVSTRNQLQTQLEEANAQIAMSQSQSDKRAEDLKARLGEQFKARSKAQSDKIREKDSQLQLVTAEKQSLEERLALMSGLQEELDATKIQRDTAVEQLTQGAANLQSENHGEDEDGEVDETKEASALQEQLDSTKSRLEVAEAQVEAEKQSSSGIQNELSSTRDRIVELDALIGSLQEEITRLKQDNSGVENAGGKAVNPSMPDSNDQATLHSPIKIIVADGTDPEASSSISDQVTRLAETTRQELQHRYDERIREVEADYKNRVERMRAQLNEKLAQGKTRARESVLVEQEQKFQSLKSEHEAQLTQLVQQHTDEVARLQQGQSAERLQKAEEPTVKDPEASDEKGAPAPASGSQGPGPEWPANEAEGRAYISSNEVFRKLIKTNILNQVNKQREAISKKKDEEHEKALAEALAKANTAKEHAIMMEGKKNNVQLNMAQNKARTAQFRLDGVQMAAQETPEKAVKEVWESVKDAKPPQSATQPNQSSIVKAPATVVNSTAPNLQRGVKAENTTTSTQKPTPTASVSGNSTSQQSTAPTTSSVEGDSSKDDTSSTPALDPATANAPIQRTAASGIPQPQEPPQQTGSRGPTTASSNRGSGLPVPRGGGAARGVSRGRGSGIGRGGPGIDTSRGGASARGRGSPTRGAFNPAAQQFVPGNKRPRDESQDGGDAPGKKIRGGAGSS